MELRFYDTGYLRDFYTDLDAPKGWAPNDDEWYVDFRAYDCTHCESERERLIYEDGYEFECTVYLRFDPLFSEGCFHEWELANFNAVSIEEAERLLQVAANALYE